MNSMVTQKNNAMACLTDNQLVHNEENVFNFSLLHTTTNKSNQLEYDDDVNIDDDE